MTLFVVCESGFMQKNKGVVRVFAETTRDIIQNIQQKHEFIYSSKINETVKEYNEFENLEIDITEMERIFREEFSSEIIKKI